jgi:hypothetical protein
MDVYHGLSLPRSPRAGARPANLSIHGWRMNFWIRWPMISVA